MKPYVIHWHTRPVTFVKTNYEGDLMLTTAKDGQICLGYTKNGERIGTYEGHNGAIYAADITMDSKYVVTGGADGDVMVWEALTGRRLFQLEHGGIVKFVEWNQRPFEQKYFVTANDRLQGSLATVPARICVWEFLPETANADAECEKIMELPMGSNKATKVKWGPADATLISIHEEGTCYIWSFPKGDRLHVIDAHQKAVTDLQFNHDRSLMITASRDMTAKIWEMETYMEVKQFKTDRPLNSAAISPLYNSAETRKYHVVVGGGQEAREVTTTAAAKGQFEACLFHMVTEEELGTVSGHFAPINTLCFLADGKGFITGGEEGYIRLHHFDPDYFHPKRWD